MNRFRRRMTGLLIRTGRQVYARAATSNRASKQRAICPLRSTVEWFIHPMVSRTRPSMNVPPASFADIAAKDSWL